MYELILVMALATWSGVNSNALTMQSGGKTNTIEECNANGLAWNKRVIEMGTMSGSRIYATWSCMKQSGK